MIPFPQSFPVDRNNLEATFSPSRGISKPRGMAALPGMLIVPISRWRMKMRFAGFCKLGADGIPRRQAHTLNQKRIHRLWR